jgi:hypothetical protein
MRLDADFPRVCVPPLVVDHDYWLIGQCPVVFPGVSVYV